ncbi:FAD-dependent oxidoreductase [Alsobacter sp. SYSU M60028]|uniref:FAD-dependent oxidoreductase n=1 Tax=Alsobacter ponti TaxID=2962936 RepID=A0ABT1LG11_9HYPH|nr:FAD-dependent oxidoreductase [Alsobacter ponti]MCP8940439.1 FAD-dependent oxidoreductase [Alsobacter ponti]
MKIVVVGAGVVGLAVAHALVDEGHAVTVVDREGPAAGASRGNAGWLAHTDIDPIASPKMLRQVPKFLLDPLGPLSIRPSYLPRLMPWLTRLVLASRPSQLARSVEALVALQRLAMPAWDRLASELDLSRLIHKRGALFVFDGEQAFALGKPHFEKQRALGIACDFLGAADLRALEPGLSERIVAGAFFPDAAHVADPLVVTQALFDAALARGVAFARADIVAIEPGPPCRAVAADGAAFEADAAVLCAGAWSKPLAARLGDAIPLDTERGYNVSFPGVTGVLSRPVAFQGHGFVATPLDTGLRIGGAVELAGLELPPNHARSRALHAKASRFLRGLPAYDAGTPWMGFRPSIPDSLPVIGRSRAAPHVLYAFGHGHYGLTQSAATARIVAALAAGREPPIDLARFSPHRFH